MHCVPTLTAVGYFGDGASCAAAANSPLGTVKLYEDWRVLYMLEVSHKQGNFREN